VKVKLEKIDKNKFTLEVIGYTCPFPTLYTLKALEKLSKDDLLEVITDNQPSCKTVPEAVESRGCKVLGIEQAGKALWKIVIRK
jgi:TusA-related sulfurtransferase